jgi:cell division protein FtsQ
VSAKRVRRGSSAARRPRKAGPRVAVPKRIAARLPVEQESANRLARWAFGLFALGTAAVAAAAVDLPGRAWAGFGEAMGDSGFRVKSVDVTGVRHMDSKPVFAIALDQQSTAMPLVDVAAIRERLLGYGWVKDARVSRRLPDTLVIDIVERTPAALWQANHDLRLIDAEGVVLEKVKVTEMPDLPLLVGPGANRQSQALEALLAEAPALKPQLESAAWVSQRRWDLHFQTGETVALPEGERDAKTALAKFARLERSSGLLGRGIVRIDLRVPGKMIVRLPPGVAPATGNETAQEG